MLLEEKVPKRRVNDDVEQTNGRSPLRNDSVSHPMGQIVSLRLLRDHQETLSGRVTWSNKPIKKKKERSGY